MSVLPIIKQLRKWNFKLHGSKGAKKQHRQPRLGKAANKLDGLPYSSSLSDASFDVDRKREKNKVQKMS